MTTFSLSKLLLDGYWFREGCLMRAHLSSTFFFGSICLFSFGRVGPLVSLWVLDSPLFLFLGSGSHQSLFLFSGGSVSHGSLVCFFFGNRESRIAPSQLAMRGSGWALDTGIVFFFLQSSSRQLQLHGNRSWTEHCGNYSTDNLTLNITSRGLESYDTPHTCFFMIISKLSCSNVLINSYLFLITNAQTTLF